VKAAIADAAAKKTEAARMAAVEADGEAAKFRKSLRVAEGSVRRAEVQLRGVEQMFEGAGEPAATVALEELKAKALGRLSEAITEFVVLMSGEPQGGIKIRRRSTYQ
jgi:hypothetical protein